ncbi:Isochorismatase-like protein [Trichoderma evansii]
MSSPFSGSISLPRTGLLLSDVQTILDFFRDQAARSRASKADPASLYDDVPLIIHHALPFNLNSNAFVSPYNKLAKWVSKLEASGFFSKTSADPHHPDFGIPATLTPPSGWGTKDEIVLGKLQPNCFASSDLLAYLRARGIRHIILVGLTTMGSILGSARAGADLDFDISLVEEAIIDDDPAIHEVLMTKVLPKFVDVVKMEDVLSLGTPAT